MIQTKFNRILTASYIFKISERCRDLEIYLTRPRDTKTKEIYAIPKEFQ
jgi:hypothetical protein